ncbi:MAG: FHA domain-containing protein [Rhodospirillaceae bacterium]
MTDMNEDRTVAFEDHSAKDKIRGGMADVPGAVLICADRSQVDGPLSGDGIIQLVPGAEQTVGRGETCTYPINSRKLSRQHARIFPGVGAWGVEDLNSTNGVRVNDSKITTAWLQHGDIVRFGPIPFRFELTRPDIAAAAAKTAAAQPAAGEGDGEHTMIFTGAGRAQAADLMLKAVREAEKSETAPPAIVPTAPVKAARDSATTPTKPAGNARLIPMIGAGVAIALLIGGGAFYYPTFKRNQEISSILERSRVTDRVIARARELVGSIPTDFSPFEKDKEQLQPLINDANEVLGTKPDSRELANLYARSKFLVFERDLIKLFARSAAEPESSLAAAADLAAKLRDNLRELGKDLDRQVAKSQTGNDQDDLKNAADLADLATILIRYRSFARQHTAGDATGLNSAIPSLEQLNAIDARRRDYIKYNKDYHLILSRDYRLFNAIILDIEGRDIPRIDSWRQDLTIRK